MKKDKELIEEIVDQLKKADDFAYKEGAWEKFGDTINKSSVAHFHLRKYASIAAMLLLSIVVVYYVLRSKDKLNNEADSSNMFSAVPSEQLGDNNEINTIKRSPSPVNIPLEESNEVNNAIQMVNANILVESSEIKRFEADVFSKLELTKPNLNYKIEELGTQISSTNEYNQEMNQNLINHLHLANRVVANNVMKNNNLEQSVSPKFFQFANRFELGLFISPYTTSENFKVGAGVALSYNISKKVSLRTGASYNTYEVGILKNPLDDSSVEHVLGKVDNSVLLSPESGANMQSSKVALPNINAVTGFVQSIEIPLEVKYNLNKSFYAVAGVSYSTIISQERRAHYVESASNDTFNGFSDAEKGNSDGLKLVTKSIKSTDNNVNPHTYSGFVNLSVGRKVNVNKKFAVSVEPYYKIPVGGYRSADMNYSNAGIRIMTNF